jgi:hypothetical protein
MLQVTKEIQSHDCNFLHGGQCLLLRQKKTKRVPKNLSGPVTTPDVVGALSRIFFYIFKLMPV